MSTRVGLSVIQRNIRKWLALRNWYWWKLYCKVKPLLNIARAEDDMKKKEEELEKTKLELEKTEKMRKELEEQNVVLLQAKNDLYLQLQAEQVGRKRNKAESIGGGGGGGVMMRGRGCGD